MTRTIGTEKSNICERLLGYSALAAAGGICGGYGVVSCGHTFPLAQTGNLIGMFEVLTEGDWATACGHLLMLVLFIAGLTATVLLPAKLEEVGGKRLTYAVTLLAEAACVGMSLFFPESMSGLVRVAPLFFLSALQYNVFKSCEGVATSTLFCTNNLRQLTISFWNWKKGGGKDGREAEAHKMLVYGMMVICYCVGVIASCIGMAAGRWILIPAAVLYLVLAVAGARRL